MIGNKTKLRVALDVDGVILDFYKHCCEYFGVPEEKLDSWSCSWIFHNEHIINDNEHFWETMPKMPMTEDGIDFDFECYMSAYPAAMIEARTKCLAMHGFPLKPIIRSDDKVNLCLAMGIHVLIDDRLATIQEAKLKGLQTIFYIADKYVHGYAAEHEPITDFRDIKHHIARIEAQMELESIMLK